MKILTVMLLLFVFYACSDEWKKKEEVTGDGLKRGTPYEILEGRGNYTIFLDAINRIGYRDLLDGKGLSTLLFRMMMLLMLILRSIILPMD